MDRNKLYQNHGFRYSKPVCEECEQKTIQGQAYTPSQMVSLAERGIPVNNLNNQKAYYDGTPDATFFVGDERTRGIDVAELWERQQIRGDKARKARMAAIEKSKS